LQPKSKYHKALSELLALEFTGMKLGLDNIRELLSVLGNPQEKFDAVHIAGSNGKGSVSAMLAAAFQANGYTVGLYTSPHLVDFRERVRINGEPITEEYISSFLEKIWEDVARLQATFFEVATALAFSYFADNHVQLAVIETGLGGRLDATNVLENPLATVITSISLEHTAQLGNTLEEIAVEKAGIMKPDVPAIVNVEPGLQEIFRIKAKAIGSKVVYVPEHAAIQEYGTIDPPFYGKHQLFNLQTVMATLENIGIPLQRDLSIQGIAATRKLSGIRARMEDYSYQPLRQKNLRLLLDVAHNPDAFRFLKEYFIENNIKPIVVAGFAKDKDVNSILHEISGFASKFIAVAAKTHRALAAEDLTEFSKNGAGLEATASSTPKHGVDLAISLAASGDVIILTGSHYVVGDFLIEVER
jgi:dihydrofolate synthase/folylpolyglutamate synthase